MDLSVDLSFYMCISRDSTGYKRGLVDIGIYLYIYIYTYIQGYCPNSGEPNGKSMENETETGII